MTRRILLLAVIFGVSTAHAEPPRIAGTDADMTHYDFDDDLVHGDIIRPDDTLEVLRSKSGYASLIDVRSSFVPELLESVEDY